MIHGQTKIKPISIHNILQLVLTFNQMNSNQTMTYYLRSILILSLFLSWSGLAQSV